MFAKSSSNRVRLRAVLAAAAAATAAFAVISGPVFAATTTIPQARGAGGGATTRLFCNQLTTSQSAIAQIKSTGKARLVTIASEWTKLEKLAPTQIKKDVTLIKAAYVKAGGQAAAVAAKTLASIAAPGQRVTTFASTGCNGGGGGGRFGDPAQQKAIADCLAKEGVTLPQGGGGGGGGGQPGTGGTRPTIDEKTRAAMQKCGANFGGGGGGGGRNMTPEVLACLAKAGVDVPAGGLGRGAGGQPGAGLADGETFRDALQKCRVSTGQTGGTGPAAAPGGVAPTTKAK